MSSVSDPNFGAAPAPSRRRAALDVVAALMRRWDAGEATEDDAVLAAHPQLAPELVEELRNARMLRRAVVMAHRLGPPVQDEAGVWRIRLLSDAEIEAPIELEQPPPAPQAMASSVAAGTAARPGMDAVVNPGLTGRDAAIRLARRLPRVPGVMLQSEISIGGQAAVYRGVQESTGRAVAVKVMDGSALGAIGAGGAADARHRARFDREAEILAALRHPHVVNILDRGRTADGDFYLLMEFVDGHDLDDWWDRHVAETEDGTRLLLAQFAKVARAVEAAHARGIIHRDLKPSNIRVDDRGEPRVLDFGLARVDVGTVGRGGGSTAAVTVSGQLLGSVPWASPEQAAGHADRLDARGDVYALGVMLYQALTGQFPYPVDGPLHRVLDRIATFAVAPPSRRRGARPWRDSAALDAVVLKALAKAPTDRYASAGELADDLDRLLGGRRVAAQPPRWWQARRPRTLAAATVCACLACAGGVTAWRATRPPEPPVVFELPSVTNSIGIRLIRIPAGSFWMGERTPPPARETTVQVRPATSQPTAAFATQNLQPPPAQPAWPRQVTVGDFYLATLEVTQSQYERVMGRRPPPQSWRGQGVDWPVQGIEWAEADEFCRRLSRIEGRTYRLPTEAEWEYACRAGGKGPFFAGAARADHVGWHLHNSGGRGHRGGEKWANAWGLFDMHGNVAEWTADVHPVHPQATTGPAARAVIHAARGGSALEPVDACRATARQLLRPGMIHRAVGFRVAMDVR